MGNKLGRRRQMVDEKYTRPQGLYHHRDVDHKKLKKLILDSKLAPCYPGDDMDVGDEKCTVDLEECPICFLFYPSLNRSRCCTKRICTECFLQMKPPHSTRPTQCPFCKAPDYAVEYHGFRGKEEMGIERVEEQRVIEAKIRMRQQELQDEEERMLKRQDISSSSRVSSFSFPVQNNEINSSQDSPAIHSIRQSSHSRQNREDEFDLDLEEIMVMEAIWLSIQEHGMNNNPAGGDSTPSVLEYRDPSSSVTMAESSPSGGFACAIAALAERQHTDGDSTAEAARNMPIFDTSLESSGLPVGGTEMQGNYTRESWIEVSPDSGRALSREEGDRGVVHVSEVEATTSYAGSDAMMEAGAALPILDSDGDHFQPTVSGPIMPESFEEQMMLAMAVSLAEARARTTTQGLPRH